MLTIRHPEPLGHMFHKLACEDVKNETQLCGHGLHAVQEYRNIM